MATTYEGIFTVVNDTAAPTDKGEPEGMLASLWSTLTRWCGRIGWYTLAGCALGMAISVLVCALIGWCFGAAGVGAALGGLGSLASMAVNWRTIAEAWQLEQFMKQ